MTVVVIHDQSAAGAVALRAAAKTAAREGHALIVLAAASGAEPDRTRDAETSALDAAVRTILGEDTEWSLQLISPGTDPVSAITEHVNAMQPDLVVLGTAHRSTVGKLVLGRAQQRVLLEIDSPVLVVKPRRD